VKHKFSFYLSSFAIIFVLGVIVLGSYTRLTNAGLGCPDWPGCYGHLVLPNSSAALDRAQSAYPQTPIQTIRAWTEMVHRYFAMTLGLIILALFIIAVVRSKSNDHPLLAPILLVGLTLFQAALGMWTVTLKLLPVVVMGHLLGGFAILSVLICLHLQLANHQQSTNDRVAKQFKPWALMGLAIVVAQIALGGWVSSNYAGLACVGFPLCNGTLMPELNWHDAFNVLSPVGTNYQGGVLDISARITIQTVHRVGAMITAFYLLALSVTLIKKANSLYLQYISVLIITLVLIQFTLGVINVTHYLPLAVAVAHTAVGALLLASVVTLTFHLFVRSKHV